MRYYWIVILALMSWVEASELKFQEGDRVVLLGNTFVERVQKYGHLETALTLAAGTVSYTHLTLPTILLV